MLWRALLLKKGINKYLLAQRKPTNNSYNLTQDFLTKEDQVEVKQLIRILKPFILATKYIEGNANSYSSRSMPRDIWKQYLMTILINKQVRKIRQLNYNIGRFLYLVIIQVINIYNLYQLTRCLLSYAYKSKLSLLLNLIATIRQALS